MSKIEIYKGNCIDYLKNNKWGWQNLIDEKVCIVTDPPFNIGYHYKSYKDNLKEEQYYDFLTEVLTFNGFPFVIIHYPENLYKLSFKIGIFPEKVVSWVYNSNTPRQHRDIAFFGVKPNFKKVIQPYKNLNDKRIRKRIAEGKKGAKLYDWWNINQVKNVSNEKTKHPCQMPIEVMKNIIGILPDDYIILDPFMGSGTTAVACKELNRNFIGFEIEEEYFKIAQDRLNGMTKKDREMKEKGQISLFDLMEEGEDN